MRYVDLFCGLGSFHYSFKKLGFECVMACDISLNIQETYFANYGIRPMGDIQSINPVSVQEFDILCAGFPCQPFSVAGKKNGFLDNRGNMFEYIMNFIHHHRPKIVILENVPALLSNDNGDTFDHIENELKKAGYKVDYKILKCDEYGIPQMRKRLFITALRNDLQTDVDFFDLKKYRRETTLSDYLGKAFIKTTAYTIRCGGKASGVDKRHNWDKYYIIENNKKLIYDLTIKDALKLQGFDEKFKLCGNKTQIWKALGNTIPTVFTEIIGKKILEIINEKV